MGTISSTLVAKLIDGISAPAKKAAASLAGIGRAASELNGARIGGVGDRLRQVSQANAARMDELRGKMVDAAGAGYLLSQALSAPIRAALDFESAMADVKKVVDFPTPQAFKDMQTAIVDMSKRIPMAASGLTSILAAAGQAGIASGDLLKFTEIAAKVGVAFDMSGEATGEALSKMKTALGMSVEEVGLLADAMNHLSNKMASSAPDILDVVRRTGATGTQMGFTAAQTSAFASAMLSAGAESDVAATSFLNMGRALTAGGEATERQREGFGRLGLDSVKIAKNMQKDAVGTTLDVMERLSKLPKYMQNATSLAIFGAEARALGPLLTNLDLLREALGYVDQAQEYAGSSAKEYEARAATTANGIQLFRNRINALGISIGTALLPGLNKLMEVLGPIVDAIANVAQAYPKLTSALVGTTAALVAFRVAAIGAAFASRFMFGGVISGAAGMVAAGGGLKGFGAAIFAPFLAFGTRIKGILQTIALRFRLAQAAGIGFGRIFVVGAMATFGRALVQLLNPLALVTAAMKVLRLAVIGTGIGAVLVGIAMAGTWIYNNWQGIGVAFEAFKGAFDRAIRPIKPLLEPVVGVVERAVGWFSDLTGAINPLNDGWARLGMTLGQGLGDGLVKFVGDMKQAIASIQATWQSFTTWMAGISLPVPSFADAKRGFDDLASKIASVAASVRASVADIQGTLKSIAGSAWSTGPTFRGHSLWGGGDAAAAPGAAPAAPPARARGGHVKQGFPYQINDDGSRDPREIFVPGRSGTILPASERRKLEAGAGGGGSVSAPINVTNNFTVNGGGDVHKIADEVSRLIARSYRRARNGSFSDIALRNA